MKIRKQISCMLCFILILQMCLLTGCSKTEFTIYDSDGNVIVSAGTVNVAEMKLEDVGMCSYIETVIDEATTMVSDIEKCTVDEAKELLVKKEYQIHTSFDANVYQSIKKSYIAHDEEKMKFGCAVTDNKGHLLAAYDGGSEEYAVYATMKTPAYSSFKPLSVYAPALEKGIISWSKTYEDSPIKQVKEADGTMRDWPANATNTYTNEPVTVAEAIKKSLNTVAVKCLQEYGVEESIQYLSEKFGIHLAYEETKMNTEGEEEVLGNIALGYLNLGVSPVDMAGYYQAFTNLGTYIEPKAVTKICDSDGKMLAETTLKETRVMNVETAYVMNLLLQGVVSKGGTAEKAYNKDVIIGGKTGTGDEGNWFVGFTPEYTCAVWHGRTGTGNKTTEIFAEIVSGLEHTEDAEFPKCGTVEMKAYCMESGMFFSASGGCRRADKGYYTSLDETKRCDIHK